MRFMCVYISVQALGASNNQWLDAKDNDGDGAPVSWNVDVFVQAIKDLVSTCYASIYLCAIEIVKGYLSAGHTVAKELLVT